MSTDVEHAPKNSNNVVEKMAIFSTCEISDALIKLGLPHGGYIPDITMISPSRDDECVRVCGRAYTVKMVLASNKSAPAPEKHFVDAAPKDSVMVIVAPSGMF